MILYFEENGDIRCISPIEIAEHKDMMCAEFPLEEVESFIKGEKSMHRFFVAKETSGNEDKFVIFEKDKGYSDVSTIDRFLTDIRSENPNDYDLLIEHDTKKCVFKFSMSGSPNQLQNKTTIRNFRTLEFYVTYLNDPNFLIHTFTVDSSQLITGDVFIGYDPNSIDFSKTSMYTKKLLSKYHYREF